MNTSFKDFGMYMTSPDETTDMTISRLTGLAKDAAQVIGYGHSTILSTNHTRVTNDRHGKKLQVVTFLGASFLLMQSIAMASVVTTKHNLGSTNSIPGGNSFSGTTEVCVFCHTPHGSNLDVSENNVTNPATPAPIWNRFYSNPNGYTTYDSLGTTSLDALAAPTGSVSLACLSCHDGTQAMNIMINTPGSGTTNTLAGTWSGAAATATPVGSLATPGKFTYIGVDLSNDHPVSIQFGGGGITDANASTAGSVGSEVTKDPYFAQPSGNSTPVPRSGSLIGQVGNRIKANGVRTWWVEANGIPGQQKDDLPLYSRNEVTVPGGNQPFVECASCHDPHSNNTTFLRHAGGNENSATCLTCHIK
jgi:hypothetical protein